MHVGQEHCELLLSVPEGHHHGDPGQTDRGVRVTRASGITNKTRDSDVGDFPEDLDILLNFVQKGIIR